MCPIRCLSLILSTLLVLSCSSLPEKQPFPTFSLNQDCKPFGVRLALGKNYVDKQQQSTISIWFNTKDQCSSSYVFVEIGAKIVKKYCTQNYHIQISSYQSYSHACYLKQVKRGEEFQYLAYGMSKKDNIPIPSHSQNLKSRLPSEDQDIRMVVLADWSFLIQKVGTYDPLDDSIDYLIQNDQIDVLYINGDIAYDLSSNQGKNYEDFLNMLSQAAVRWPTIMVTGNHERKTQTDFDTFSHSFEVFNMTDTNLTTIDFGTANMIIFDPFSLVFKEKGSDIKLFQRFQAQMEKLQKEGKPIISSSHYPLACSGSSTHCKNQRYILADYFQSMIKHHSVFYLGAHYHTYERLYPFIGNGNFDLNHEGPYNLNKQQNYLVSVVEGISGNDDHIVQEYGSFQPFTASVSYNKTGFGVMTFSSDTLVYQHFIATDPVTPVDQVQISYQNLFKPSQKNSNIRMATE